MEYYLTFDVPEILERTKIYRLNRQTLLPETLKKEYNNKNTKNLNELTIRVAHPKFEDERKNVTQGAYEGGYTIWESTWSLLAFLETIEKVDNLNVLELGSGVGLCGVFLSLRGCKATFQDLNLKVIENVIIPNLLLNRRMLDKPDETNQVKVNMDTIYKDENKSIYIIRSKSVKFEEKDQQFEFEYLVGDWNKIVDTKEVLKNLEKKFDLIIASECIYRMENYNPIVKIISSFMKDSGKAYLATKRFYFGLSGGTFQFLQFVKEFKDWKGPKLKGKIHKSMEPINSSNVIDLIELTKETSLN